MWKIAKTSMSVFQTSIVCPWLFGAVQLKWNFKLCCSYFFPNSVLWNRGCSLSMDAAYTRTFTVYIFVYVYFFKFFQNIFLKSFWLSFTVFHSFKNCSSWSHQLLCKFLLIPLLLKGRIVWFQMTTAGLFWKMDHQTT